MMNGVFPQRALLTICRLALVLCVLLMSTACQRDTSPEWLPKSVPTGYLIEPFPSRDSNVPNVDGYPILKRAPLTSGQAQALANSLGDDDSYVKGIVSACMFEPRLAFVYQVNGKPFNVLVCLKCGDISADGGFPQPGMLSKKGHEFFRGLTIELFPNADQLEDDAAASHSKATYRMGGADRWPSSNADTGK